MKITSNECMVSVLIKNPLGNDIAECLLYSPSLATPEECINVEFEDVAELLMRRAAPYIAQLLQSNHFSNATGSRIITNLKPEVRDDVYCILYPEEYALPEKNESCLLYTSPSPRDLSTSRMPSSA